MSISIGQDRLKHALLQVDENTMTNYERLSVEQQYYQKLFELAPIGYLLTNEDGLIERANFAAAEMLKIEPQFLIGNPLTVFPIPEQQIEFRTRLIQLRREHKVGKWEFCIQPRHGQPIEVELTVLPAPAQEKLSLWWILRDITQQKELQGQLGRRNAQLALLNEQLRCEQERLQLMSSQVMHVQEQERTDIARELHDEIGQLLTGLKFVLERTRQMEGVEAHKNLDAAVVLVQQLMGQVREISLDLRPPLLTDLGLFAALLWHFDRYTARTGVTVEFTHDDAEARFVPEVELAAYRIIQEALTNIARHAHTDNAQISVIVRQDELCITIQDKGIGFDVHAAQSQYRSSGLTSIQ